MKNFTLLSTLLLFAVCSFAQKITRGPDIGEIYFLGPTHTGTGLYYSTDLGETAVCVDSVKDFKTIAADIEQGGIYCVEMPHNLYYSPNYGNNGSWVFKNGATELSENIESGINSGRIFSNFYMHSENFGINFIYHSCNGYFGDVREFGVDYINDNYGYVFSVKLTNADTSYLFRTFDKFENVEVIQKYYFPNGQTKYLFSGSEEGEIYVYFKELGVLKFSNNYAESFNIIDKFNIINYASFDLIGGIQIGEVYILYSFINMMWQNAHTYIFHSTDYGKTFEVFHPFAKGNEPLLANFSAIDKEIPITSPLQFSNFSIGDIEEYQWDFDNDGIIDSYEGIPVYTYADTGWYSVKLTIVGADSTNSFVKQDYIHVIDTTTGAKERQLEEIGIIPNPFLNQITITSASRSESTSISIYNLKGEKIIETLERNNKSITINTSGLDPGVYILNIFNQNTSLNYKIIKK